MSGVKVAISGGSASQLCKLKVIYMEKVHFYCEFWSDHVNNAISDVIMDFTDTYRTQSEFLSVKEERDMSFKPIFGKLILPAFLRH